MNVLIVDDELLAGEYLEDLIKAYCPEIKKVSNFTSPVKALERVRKENFDLAFLDVEMPEMDCFEFLEKAKLPKATSVVITTAYSQYAIKAFEQKAVHYLLKPIERESLSIAVQRVLESNSIFQKAKVQQKAEEKSIFVKSVLNGEKVKVVVRQIKFVKAAGDYLELFFNDEKILLRATMKSIQLKLQEFPSFMRTHKSYLVNMDLVSRIDKTYVQIDNLEIPVSRLKRSEVKKYFTSNQ